MSLLLKLKETITRYPITRGMLSYSIIWPSGCFLQQMIITKEEQINWSKCFRFMLWGGFFVAPTLYGWVRISTIMFPSPSLKAAFYKAIIEQISYTPFAMTSFYFGMSLLESKTVNEALTEVSTKVPSTYKVALAVWPTIAFINFGFIPERNRVIFISVCSLCWTTFLAYVKQLDKSQVIDEHGKRKSLFS